MVVIDTNVSFTYNLEQNKNNTLTERVSFAKTFQKEIPMAERILRQRN